MHNKPPLAPSPEETPHSHTYPAYPLEQPDKLQQSNKGLLHWALICLIAPTAVCVLAMAAMFLIAFSSISHPSGVDDSILYNLFNAAYRVSSLAWLPGIIIGLILLNRKARNKASQQN